jgi:CubicO group peptidase (beta-lactamase class C family)
MDLPKLEKFIFAKLSKSKLPGLSVAVVGGEDLLWSRGFGFRDLAHGLAATPHTLYAIASITKSFTCLAVMQLQEQGKLSLADPVDKHIPFGLQSAGEPVRIEHLMSHASGIPALAYAESVIRSAIGAGEHWLPISSYADLITFMEEAEEWAIAKPGERFFYLNEGYVLLGYIIEQCAGVSYQEYLRSNIFQPLGMDRTFFEKGEVEKDQDVATPYIITRDNERKPSVYPYGSISSDGGILSNVLDLVKYVSLFLGWGESQREPVLSRESIEEMQTFRVKTPLEGPFGDVGYGLGLGITPDFLGRKLVGHSGSVGVATSYIGFIPEENVGIALLANGDGYPMSQIGMVGLAVLLGEDPDELHFVAKERVLTELEGTYETYKGTMKAQVKRNGDFLTIEVRDKFTDTIVPLVPEKLEKASRTFFTLANGNRLSVEFRVEKDQVDLIYERYYLKKTGELPA